MPQPLSLSNPISALCTLGTLGARKARLTQRNLQPDNCESEASLKITNTHCHRMLAAAMNIKLNKTARMKALCICVTPPLLPAVPRTQNHLKCVCLLFNSLPFQSQNIEDRHCILFAFYNVCSSSLPRSLGRNSPYHPHLGLASVRLVASLQFAVLVLLKNLKLLRESAHHRVHLEVLSRTSKLEQVLTKSLPKRENICRNCPQTVPPKRIFLDFFRCSSLKFFALIETFIIEHNWQLAIELVYLRALWG